MPPRPAAGTTVALGCRVRSGRAIVAALCATDRTPALVDCREIALSDPARPESIQPYHEALVDHQLKDMAATRPLIAAVKRAARQSVAALLKDYAARGWRVDRATLVVGSLIDPATIANQHMRAHALEGQLFRTALAEALDAGGVRCAFLLEKRAYGDAAQALPHSSDALRRTVGDMGKTRTGPWRADEKLAALGAWTALGVHSSASPR